MEGAVQVKVGYRAHIPLHEAQPSPGAALLPRNAEEPAARHPLDADLLGHLAGPPEGLGRTEDAADEGKCYIKRHDLFGTYDLYQIQFELNGCIIGMRFTGISIDKQIRLANIICKRSPLSLKDEMLERKR